MLVLDRKPDESIIIDNNIEVTIVRCNSAKVRLSVNAPKNIAVDRKEVHEAKKRCLAQ